MDSPSDKATAARERSASSPVTPTPTRDHSHIPVAAHRATASDVSSDYATTSPVAGSSILTAVSVADDEGGSSDGSQVATLTPRTMGMAPGPADGPRSVSPDANANAMIAIPRARPAQVSASDAALRTQLRQLVASRGGYASSHAVSENSQQSPQHAPRQCNHPGCLAYRAQLADPEQQNLLSFPAPRFARENSLGPYHRLPDLESQSGVRRSSFWDRYDPYEMGIICICLTLITLYWAWLIRAELHDH
ncbi:hypothetical protein Hte_000611 [Hypoxylon texense]